ncbi:quinon protein alcohol dehydrogenase-like superfamily [Suillus occidentalis]|nr:quinon protein alcohol dehydrogenase-like superfamily [Suillus occidentalis]
MDAPMMHNNNLATMLLQKTEVDNLRAILCLPDKRRIIVLSHDGSFRVMDLEMGTQVGEEWEDKDDDLETMVLSPDGKKAASGNWDGAVKLWSVDTGKVIKTWTGYTKEANSVSWSPDGGRVVSGFEDGTFRVWDVESGKTILGPIAQRDDVHTSATFSVDGKFLLTCCDNDHIYTWDVSAIVKRAGLPSDILDVTPRPAPKIKGARVPSRVF